MIIIQPELSETEERKHFSYFAGKTETLDLTCVKSAFFNGFFSVIVQSKQWKWKRKCDFQRRYESYKVNDRRKGIRSANARTEAINFVEIPNREGILKKNVLPTQWDFPLWGISWTSCVLFWDLRGWTNFPIACKS